jgi:tetratricopeptide (TPR) repeat protein
LGNFVEIDAKSSFLVASSNTENKILLHRILKNSGFSHTKDSANGIEAINICIKEHFDFIIADVELKYLSGLNFIKECKNHEKIKNIPIILVGIQEFNPEWKNDLEEYGVPGYLVHPFDPKALLSFLAGSKEQFLDPESIESLYSQAKDALIEENTEHAIESYAALQEKTDKATRSTLGLVHAYSQKNDIQAMDQALLEVKDSNNKQALLLKYKSTLASAKFDEAKDVFSDILKGEEENPFYYLRSLNIAVSCRAFDHVKAIADSAIKKDFSSPDFLIGRAKAFYSMSDTKAALTDLSRAEKKYGLSLSLLNLRAICFRKEKKYDQAITCYNQALEIESMNHLIYFNLGLCLQATGRIEEAKESYSTCLQYGPRFLKAKEKLDELNLKESA